MTTHVLTGDALLYNFPNGKLEGSLVINRECLIEGPASSKNLDEFWNERELYLTETYPESDINYQDEVVFEFEKLNDLKDGDEVNLWFEHDLFCQVNLWFTLSILPEKDLSVYRVFPVVEKTKNLWLGFGPMSSNELMNCFVQRVRLTPDDLELGRNLWKAYSNSDYKTLVKLGDNVSPAFLYLKEVCEAHTQRIPKGGQPGRPERVLKEIIDSGNNTFEKAFQKFSELEGVYGFGDSQVKNIYDRLT